MKYYLPRLPSPPRPRRSIPSFYAVPMRARTDGWTPVRQAEFIGWLAETRSVAEAARRVSMARETAYRLRARPGAESFVAAWDAALGKGADGPLGAHGSESHASPETLRRKVTDEELHWRVETGLWRVYLRDGKYLGTRRKPDDDALLALVARHRRGRDRRTLE